MTALFPFVTLLNYSCAIVSLVTSHDHFDSEVVLDSLDADWAAFCSEVTGIMPGGGFTFEFKMTYMYSYHTDMDLDDYTDPVDKCCQSGSQTHKKFSSSSDHPRFIIALSHAKVWKLLYLDDDFLVAIHIRAVSHQMCEGTLK